MTSEFIESPFKEWSIHPKKLRLSGSSDLLTHRIDGFPAVFRDRETYSPEGTH